uniref:NADH-ubiquinone oxidoreductase chain 4L n=1 Tax=Diptera sp. 53 LC-2017 TaxID=2030330 RepID=A0A2D1CQ01_9DIPT|nr:NADH dehydrogenase subunit 4L [Diptera sp. 53 LC-2017]
MMLMIFFSGMMVFMFNYKFLIINLLSIEYMMLFLLLMLMLKFNYNNNDFFFIMMFLTFMVCEGVLGLSLMISMIRSFGNNNLFNLFYLKL